jgi:hypothetical protein
LVLQIRHTVPKHIPGVVEDYGAGFACGRSQCATYLLEIKSE